MAKTTIERVIPSSGNVFADMGLPDAVELDTKAALEPPSTALSNGAAYPGRGRGSARN